ncbi:DUF6318 family protein [Galactobacter valiniphilus]|uniref:DUF6318 family protein n=1 Tax=Galactobacter valiniphilus TaxID=2676122 RepID=UPI0011C3E4FD|nr:DUF6318 family protein [Galactobacter valiniphilus]
MSQRRSSLAGAAIALALACAAALTACTGPGDPPAGTLSAPGSSPTGTTAPTGLPASASPGATGTGGTGASSLDPNAYQPATSTSPAKNVPKPVMPEAAKKKDLEGQKAFIQYWISTYNYMRESGDTGPFLAACEKTSKFCSGSATAATAASSEGIWRVGVPVTITDIQGQGTGTSKADASILATLHEPPYEYFPAGSATGFSPRHESQVHSVSIDLRFTDGRWTILEMGQL